MNRGLDLRPIILVTGILVTTLGVAMILPAVVDLAAGNPDWRVFLASSMLTSLVGFSLFMAARGTPRGLSTRQALLMTVVSWVALVSFGALPFMWSGIVDGYTDAFFESMSGLTTTGATVIVDLDVAPPGILFWRGLLQWLGGLGIIVMAIAVLPMLQIGGLQLFKAEAFDTAGKILPKAAQISSSITLVFIAFTVICCALFAAAGMPIGDAVIHSMTTVATGGFSTKDLSIGYFQSAAIDWITIVFMILGSIPFVLYVQTLQGRLRPILTDSQVHVFLGTVATATIIAWLMAHFGEFHVGLEGLRYAAFNVVSILTGTGYATTDYGIWGPHATSFFFVIMFIGGCAGSTSCGIKIFRFQVLYATSRVQMKRLLSPNGVFIAYYNKKPIPNSVEESVMSFFFLFMAIFGLLALSLGLLGLDFITATSGAATAISNVGPGLGDVIGPAGTFASLPDAAKWLLSGGMLLGRLEIFTVLILLAPSFWRG